MTKLHRNVLTLTPSGGQPIKYEFNWTTPLTTLGDFLAAMAETTKAAPDSPLFRFAEQWKKPVRGFLKDWIAQIEEAAAASGEDGVLLAEVPAPELTEREARRLATHRHYKGGLYRYLVVGEHTETNEKMVVYEHLWPHKRSIWIRPEAIFNSPVEETGAVRFQVLRPFAPMEWHELTHYIQVGRLPRNPQLKPEDKITVEYLLAKGHNMVVFEPRYSNLPVAVVFGGSIESTASLADGMTDSGDSVNHIQSRVCGRYYPYGEGRTLPEALAAAMDKINTAPREALQDVLIEVWNTSYNSDPQTGGYRDLEEIPDYSSN